MEQNEMKQFVNKKVFSFNFSKMTCSKTKHIRCGIQKYKFQSYAEFC